jgi:hypothetical protein
MSACALILLFLTAGIRAASDGSHRIKSTSNRRELSSQTGLQSHVGALWRPRQTLQSVSDANLRSKQRTNATTAEAPHTKFTERTGLEPSEGCSGNSNSKHVALAFYGLTRSLHYTIKSIRSNIFVPLTESGYTYDVYLHTYDLKHLVNQRSKESGSLNTTEWILLNPDFYRITNQVWFDRLLGEAVHDHVTLQMLQHTLCSDASSESRDESPVPRVP